jgi:1-aminocyclopropane-1-carboxylate deaminase
MISPITIKRIDSALLAAADIHMDVAFLDTVHPLFGGNKWFKLKYNIEEAKRRQAKAIVTFGGANSNHIYATAAACQYFGIPSIGMIRGEATELNNPTLSKVIAWGMDIHLMSKLDYAEKETELFEYELHERFGNIYIIPEGGHNYLGINGCMEILKDLPNDYNLIAVSVGSGTTIAGLLLSAHVSQNLIGFAPMKGGQYLKESIAYDLLQFLGDQTAVSDLVSKLTIIDDYHFGGFAKINDNLKDFKSQFGQAFGFELDYVYNAKLFYGLFDKIQKQEVEKHQKILVIHTGGLQGNKGFEI